MTPIEVSAVIVGLIIGYLFVNKLINLIREKPHFSSKEDGPPETAQQYSYQNEEYEPDYKASPTNEEKEKEKTRIFSCPACGQKIRVRLPLTNTFGKCSKCNDKFIINIDDTGNLYITNTIYKRGHRTEEPSLCSVEDCFALLGLPNIATSIEIKAAYRKKMKEYHPDKVASLGGKLKEIAERETKSLNKAMRMLKDRGYL